MVHNGIEYAIMQLIGETYQLMRDVLRIEQDEMAAVFRRWNAAELQSYLIEITADILAKRDHLASGPLVEAILDKAGQKGTGRWSSQAALEFGVPAAAIAAAVFARAMASLKEERVAASAILKGPAIDVPATWDQQTLDDLRQALLGAFVASFAQGFALIAAGAREHGWQTDLAAVARVWRSGCVIRAALLDDMADAFEHNTALPNLMCAPAFAEILNETQTGWRRTVALAVRQGIPAPALTSALSYYDGYRTPRLPANLIQAQRDCFGAHGYERSDRPGSFHTQW